MVKFAPPGLKLAVTGQLAERVGDIKKNLHYSLTERYGDIKKTGLTVLSESFWLCTAKGLCFHWSLGLLS